MRWVLLDLNWSVSTDSEKSKTSATFNMRLLPLITTRKDLLAFKAVDYPKGPMIGTDHTSSFAGYRKTQKSGKFWESSHMTVMGLTAFNVLTFTLRGSIPPMPFTLQKMLTHKCNPRNRVRVCCLRDMFSLWCYCEWMEVLMQTKKVGGVLCTLAQYPMTTCKMTFWVKCQSRNHHAIIEAVWSSKYQWSW